MSSAESIFRIYETNSIVVKHPDIDVGIWRHILNEINIKFRFFSQTTAAPRGLIFNTVTMQLAKLASCLARKSEMCSKHWLFSAFNLSKQKYSNKRLWYTYLLCSRRCIEVINIRHRRWLLQQHPTAPFHRPPLFPSSPLCVSGNRYK